ncbi:HetZ-related protein 2 [Chroococcidiopsis sp.]|uniref:HetZ-related protein 2 n=1 Tax=Chroococcidiopsis sp. TaxID=3088168 RepID=UPI003F345D8F
MQTIQVNVAERDRHLATAAEISQEWRLRLTQECPAQSDTARESIVRWLIGEDTERYQAYNSLQLSIAQQAMEYRFRILKQRYLGVSPQQAYHRLTIRLCSLVLLRNKIHALVALGSDRRRAVVDVLQEIIQDLLQRDRYLQQQTAWIAACTDDMRLRTALLLTTVEEYCLRPIHNRPLIVHRFVNFLRRTQMGGVTQVPERRILKLLSDEFLSDDSDRTWSAIDVRSVSVYQDSQNQAEQYAARHLVQSEFSNYLTNNLGETAAQWLELYLQGRSQEAIAQQLNLSVKEVYRLREKIVYHAVKVFGLKHHPELVGHWLGTSLEEHSFGLTPKQWQEFWEQLTPRQRQVVELRKSGKNLDAIAYSLNRKLNQITSEWNKLCLVAQIVRSGMN